MPIPISSEEPILVVVTEDSWNAYSYHTIPTPRDHELFALIQKMGGIDDTVEPGSYHFNAAVLDEHHMVASLESIRE